MKEEQQREYQLKWELFRDLVRNKARILYFDAYRFMSEDNPVDQ